MSQAQRRGGFTVVGEPVDPLQLDRPRRRADLAEQATATDGLELSVITHQHQTPLLTRREPGEMVQVRGRQHARLVDDQRGARRKPPLRA